MVYWFSRQVLWLRVRWEWGKEGRRSVRKGESRSQWPGGRVPPTAGPDACSQPALARPPCGGRTDRCSSGVAGSEIRHLCWTGLEAVWCGMGRTENHVGLGAHPHWLAGGPTRLCGQACSSSCPSSPPSTPCALAWPSRPPSAPLPGS